MAALVMLLAVFSCAPIGQADAVAGRLVDARTGKPIAGAEITIVGQRGAVKTDRDGRFRWPIPPPLPALLIAVLPDGRVARQIQLASSSEALEIAVDVDATLSESVVVTGVAPTVDVSPAASTTLLTARDLEMRHPQTLTQSLDMVPGVSAIAEGQAAVPAIRGLARGRTSIFVDGSRSATERRAGANASFLDPGIVRSIEVARGPGSVAYGSDAFGGVIAARTRGPAYNQPWGVRFASTAGWGVPELRGDVEVSRGYGSGGILVGLRAREFEDYDAPAGAVTNSSWKDRGARARWEHTTQAGIWSVGWQSDIGRDLGRPRSDSDVMLATSPVEDSHRFTASYERRSLRGFRNIRFNALAGASRQRTEQERLATPTRPRNIERGDVSSREMEVRLTGERLVRGTRLHFGTDIQRRAGLEALDTTLTYNAAGNLVSETSVVSIDDAHRTAVGVFAESEAQVATWFRISGGLRLDTVRNTNDGGFYGDRSVSNTAVAGLVAATLTAARRVTLTAQVASGFRDPTLSDRFYRGPVGRGFVQGNPDLKPERSVQFDVSARYVAGPVRFAAAGYHYNISELIERYTSTATLFLFRNRGNAELSGVEAEAQATLPQGFSIWATAETSRGRDAVDGTPLDDVAPASVSLTVRHSLGSRLASYLRVKAVGSHAAAGPSEVPTGSYEIVDAGFRTRLTQYLDLVGTMRNLLNEEYQSSAGPRWVWAPGRHGSVTLVASF